jgi:hypothetical protein
MTSRPGCPVSVTGGRLSERRILAAKVAPQRSTQYAALAAVLSLPELRLSPLGQAIGDVQRITLSGQPYLLLELTEPLDAAQERCLWQMGATSEFFWFHDAVGGVQGPFLQPLTPPAAPLLPAQLVEARRYRGKTNELFAQVLVNLARWAHPGRPRALLDPLMGGGTFVFIALRLGLHATGIEQQKTDLESTDSFLDSFLGESRIRFRRTAERAPAGRRFLYTIQPDRSAPPQRAALVHGDTIEAPRLLAELPRELRPDLIVADLPYGIQHQGLLHTLLERGLTAWTQVAAADAVLALAWDATHTPRPAVAELVEASQSWSVLRGGAWEELPHGVDRVIRRRDVIVARRNNAAVMP